MRWKRPRRLAKCLGVTRIFLPLVPLLFNFPANQLVKPLVHDLEQVLYVISVSLIQLSVCLSVFCECIIMWHVERLFLYVGVGHRHRGNVENNVSFFLRPLHLLILRLLLNLFLHFGELFHPWRHLLVRRLV